MFSNWFRSRTCRQAEEVRQHLRKILAAQSDLLTPAAVAAMNEALDAVGRAVAERDDLVVTKRVGELEAAATKWLKPYPNPGLRENVEVLLVALAVAMGIRTFFLQPFKIPTGSMQPTLYGVTHVPGKDPDFVMPGFLARMYHTWVDGVSYVDITAPEAGRLNTVAEPFRLALFNLYQEYEFNHIWHRIWFPPDDLFERAGFGRGFGRVDSPEFKAGDHIARMVVRAGDHLFVDRLSYNFRHPRRGEIIVFETAGIGNHIAHLPPDQFYIKRLVALGGEKVQIGADRHLVIDGKRLDQTTPHFEMVYSFAPDEAPRDSHYSGHVNNRMLAPLFQESPDGTVQVRPEHFMVMGDNTMNSYDSRAWGDFSRTNVIGRYCVVYWPFGERFGWKAR